MASTTNLPPGPRLPAIVQTAWLVRDPVGFLEQCRRRFGPVFRARIVGFPRYVYVTDPAIARRVLAGDRDGALAGEARREFLEPLVGRHSLLVVEGDEWARQRKLVAPAFHRRNVETLEADVGALAREEIERWPLGEPFALRPAMQAITLEVILRLVFGITDRARLDRLREVLPKLMETAASPLLWALPAAARARLDTTPLLRRVPGPLGRFFAVRDEVDALLYAEIAARRAEDGDGRRDVLAQLMAARDEDGRPMSDEELRDELITLLEAGHETTATGLAWAFERLVRSPAELRRLVAELDEDGEQYLEAVVKETLRSRSVILDTPRLLTRPLDVGGYEIPEGWYVAPALPLVHHTAAAHDDPAAFRPERFLGDGGGQRAWMPFGGGRRHCVGSQLALLEMKVVLRETLRRLDLEPVREAPEGMRLHHVTLVPSELARVRARKRAAAPAGRTPAAMH